MASSNYQPITKTNDSNNYMELLTKCYANTLGTFRIPILEWLPHYTKKDLEGDINAGIVVFILLIPQGMAYAVLAGVPPIYGLYCAVVPLYTYSIFGTSRQLSIAAFAIMSLLVGALLQDLGYVPESDEYIGAAMTLSLMSGIISCLMGFLQLGALTNFISQTVINGFINASAFIVLINQLKYLFGIDTNSMDYTFQIVLHILVHIGETKWATLIISISTFSFLYYCKLWKAENKNPTKEKLALDPYLKYKIIAANGSGLIGVIVSAVMAYLFIQNDINVDIVGDVPAGMQAPKLPPLGDVGTLLPAAFIIAVMGFLSNWAIASKFAQMHGYDVQASQELIAVGLSNILGSFFNAFPVAGGLARSAANNDAGARTTMAGIITATLMVIALFALTTTFYYIPKAVLGTIIVTSVISMIDMESFKRAKAKSQGDFIVLVGTFVLTLGLGITIGLMGGVVISICIFLFNNAFPHIAVLGVLDESQSEAESGTGVGIDCTDSTLPSPLKNKLGGINKLVSNITNNNSNTNTMESTQLASSLMSILYDDVIASKNNTNTTTSSTATAIAPSPCMSNFINNLSTMTFRDVSTYNVRFIRGISIVRMESSLMFANSAQFKSTIRLLAQGKHVEVGQGEKIMKYLPFYESSMDGTDGTGMISRDITTGSGSGVGLGAEDEVSTPTTEGSPKPNSTPNPATQGPLKLIIIDVSSWSDIDLVGMSLLKELQTDLMKQPLQPQGAACINPNLYCNGILFSFVYAHQHSVTYNKIISADLTFESDDTATNTTIVYDTMEDAIGDFPRRWDIYSKNVLTKRKELELKNSNTINTNTINNSNNSNTELMKETELTPVIDIENGNKA